MMRSLRAILIVVGLAVLDLPAMAQVQGPTDLQVVDHGWDNGKRLDVSWRPAPGDGTTVKSYHVQRTTTPLDETSWSTPPEIIVAGDEDLLKVEEAGGAIYRLSVVELEPGTEYTIRVAAVDESNTFSPWVVSTPVAPRMQLFDGDRAPVFVMTVAFCASVIFWIYRARAGREIKVRKIAGLEAVDEAVGRATEMGRSCLFVPGTQDINDIQTIAGITILSRVAKTAAEYDAKVEVPTSRALVMTTARETVQAAFLSAGRPDAYNQDLIYYVTDEQFGYVAYLQGMMVREKPAACFYMGSFFAESLILAETGNSIGAIQIAGTAQPAQLPFFVAACDYTLIGEEFFAASAYLSGSPEELGSLKGQDVGKIIVVVLLALGVALATAATITGKESLRDAVAVVQEILT
jgi:hypothetical protein